MLAAPPQSRRTSKSVQLPTAACTDDGGVPAPSRGSTGAVAPVPVFVVVDYLLPPSPCPETRLAGRPVLGSALLHPPALNLGTLYTARSTLDKDTKTAARRRCSCPRPRLPHPSAPAPRLPARTARLPRSRRCLPVASRSCQLPVPAAALSGLHLHRACTCTCTRTALACTCACTCACALSRPLSTLRRPLSSVHCPLSPLSTLHSRIAHTSLLCPRSTHRSPTPLSQIPNTEHRHRAPSLPISIPPFVSRTKSRPRHPAPPPDRTDKATPPPAPGLRRTRT